MLIFSFNPTPPLLLLLQHIIRPSNKNTWRSLLSLGCKSIRYKFYETYNINYQNISIPLVLRCHLHGLITCLITRGWSGGKIQRSCEGCRKYMYVTRASVIRHALGSTRITAEWERLHKTQCYVKEVDDNETTNKATFRKPIASMYAALILLNDTRKQNTVSKRVRFFCMYRTSLDKFLHFLKLNEARSIIYIIAWTGTKTS